LKFEPEMFGLTEFRRNVLIFRALQGAWSERLGRLSENVRSFVQYVGYKTFTNCYYQSI